MNVESIQALIETAFIASILPILTIGLYFTKKGMDRMQAAQSFLYGMITASLLSGLGMLILTNLGHLDCADHCVPEVPSYEAGTIASILLAVFWIGVGVFSYLKTKDS